MLLLMLTAQEGRLGVDRRASLNTDQASRTTVQRGICVPWPWKPVHPSASKPAETLLFYSGANTAPDVLWNAEFESTFNGPQCDELRNAGMNVRPAANQTHLCHADPSRRWLAARNRRHLGASVAQGAHCSSSTERRA